MVSRIVTCEAPVNIAVIKYWGKRDEGLILPLNDSLSGTLCTEQMCTTTTISISPTFHTDRLWLNGKEESVDNARLQSCILEVKVRAQLARKLSPEELSWRMHICSENNFPTAAGLASSAAGYACLVYALCKLFQIDGDISAIARRGSGSACRSIYGGFVEWIAGCQEDGSDSIAKQIVDHNYWPEMRVLILVVSDSRKKTSSTSGMQKSVETSDLLKYRVANCVPERQDNMKKAILKRDFSTFATLTMKDSNQLHGVCLDTFPPCIYMNDVSHAVADLIHLINADVGKTVVIDEKEITRIAMTVNEIARNESARKGITENEIQKIKRENETVRMKSGELKGRNVVAYTFDAGPNACLYLLEEHIPIVLAAVNYVFPSGKNQEFYKGMPIDPPLPTALNKLPSVLKREPWEIDTLQYVMHTKIGSGPRVVSDSCHDNTHLLNHEGLPNTLL